MIYIRMKPSATCASAVHLCDIADVVDDRGMTNVGKLELPAPNGVIHAMDVLQAVLAQNPKQEVSLLGAEVCVVRAPKRTPKWRENVSAIVMSVFLFLGSGMAITYFHADVDMPSAQQRIMHALTGNDTLSPLWSAVPYALGIAVGAIFFLRPRNAPPPLAIKMMQQAQEIDEYEAQNRDGNE